MQLRCGLPFDDLDTDDDVESTPKMLDGVDIYSLGADDANGLERNFWRGGRMRMHIFQSTNNGECTRKIVVGCD